ncbi:phosphopantetheine-binding protein [Paenibacillus chitinolyticus]|uniref:acyl carrier protein n=1 Tax=Paenibacillus chitinolyticus TaxID=79263 RepID=UPI002DBB63D9|nr:phosphopantetheine-binding protein [Paenibacillus chitinolyticus]MEC0248506.1 phosphopantetheine-binding protein [Paenibacillus chitinolyticus]
MGSEQVAAAVRDILGRIKRLDKPVEPDRNLIEYGYDSMNIMQLIVDLEIHFGIAFPEEQLLTSNFSTIDSIVSLIEAGLNK